MLRFFRQKSSPEINEDLISDYLEFRQTVRHGFPSRVSCFAYDRILSLLAIGNLDGDINIYGGNGFIWSTEIPGKKGMTKSVAHMYFASGLGILIALCRDATFVRFSLEGSQLLAQSVLHETRLKKITSCCMMERPNTREAKLLIGSVSGNVFALDINTLDLSEYIVFEDVLLQRCEFFIVILRLSFHSVIFSMYRIPENSRREKYPVDLLSICPTNTRITIMVFDHCLLIAYDSSTNEIMGSNVFDIQCKNITWTRDGSRFVVALHDGSYACCSPTSTLVLERPPLVFGPFPCTSSRKAFFVETSRSVCGRASFYCLNFRSFHKGSQCLSTSERMVLFSGGMPHASYGDRFTVTARQGDRTCVFDFSSPVIDFTLTYGDDGYHSCALVLTENELVCIDLRDRFWRVIPTEQVFPLHASQITTTTHCAHVDEHVWNKLVKIAAENVRLNRKFSSAEWPLNAKIPVLKESRSLKEATKRQLYITGHENGTVRVWSAGHANMKLLFVIDTRNEFCGFSDVDKEEFEKESAVYDTESSEDEFHITGEWPPFKKVGDYDPFCDDAALSIQKIVFDEKSGHIVAGARGGHVLLYSIEETDRVLTPQLLSIELSKLPTANRYTKALALRTKPLKYIAGYQPYSPASQNKSILVQLQPALAVSAVAVLSSRHLIAASNEYGFALVDINRKTVLLQNSLVTQSDMPNVGALDDALSRFKSMKKSIRQTFRRKKKTPVTSLDNTIGTLNSDSSTKEIVGNNVAKVFSDNEDDEVEVSKPVERLIEERGSCPLESPVWFIRCLRFLSIPVMGIAGANDIFVVGTNGGKVIIYSITDQPRAEDVCRMLKTIALRHSAPVIHIDVIMELGTRASSARLIIFTEEQLRSFYFPSLKPSRYKLKLTSTEGLRIRRGSIVTLHNRNDLSNCENFAAIVNNHGEVAVYSLLNPKKNGKFAVAKITDIAGISSMLITPYGELLFLRQGGSELQRATISEHSLPWVMPCQEQKWPESVITTCAS
ncbi:LLGL2 protein [Dictyocaulus viviparus]|uniref:LLGL2 protein n=1 Tax=Dictyocaulus viviparus TaxID=29172 RepID=A0A0D8X735_DICVI|nr:LLGL2 protein [Dictyocaulus viviparus]